jgi:predicted nucleic acid-binding protein
VRIILDANVLVSAFLSRTGPLRAIVASWVDERFYTRAAWS